MYKLPHQRDLLGQDIVDFEERVDVSRLKRERLARLQMEIARADLGGLLLYDPLNVRYATGIRAPGSFALRFFRQHALVPREGNPVYFGSLPNGPVGEDILTVKPALVFDFFHCGRNVEPSAHRWADGIKETMRELGIAGEPLGIDRLDFHPTEALRAQEIQMADGHVALEKARVIKTQDEVSLIRQACAVGDIAICNVRDAIKPGVTEDDLFAILAATNIRHGGEQMEGRLLTAGGNTNPWMQRASDRLVRPGDLVAFDTDMIGPSGYMADVSRTYLCGDGKPNAEQLEAYKLAYNFIYESLHLFRPGVSFPEIAEKAYPIPDEYKPGRYSLLAHGVGMCDEWPSIYWPDVSRSGFGNDPDVLEENMVISLEGLASKVGAKESVKLEEQLLITANGPEVLSQAPFDWRFLS